MPKIKITSAHYVSGLGGVSVGQILDVEETEARRKIQMGYAELYVEPTVLEAEAVDPIGEDEQESSAESGSNQTEQ